jgi:uncharacterized membrane protein HdeD (DUF308 family)
MFRRLTLAAAATALLMTLSAGPIRAQGCSQCVTVARAQSEKGQRAINAGIFTLLAPTLALFGGVFTLAWKRRNAP